MLTVSVMGWEDNSESCVYSEIVQDINSVSPLVSRSIPKCNVRNSFQTKESYLSTRISSAAPVLEFSGTCSILNTVSIKVTFTLLSTRANEQSSMKNLSTPNKNPTSTSPPPPGCWGLSKGLLLAGQVLLPHHCCLPSTLSKEIIPSLVRKLKRQISFLLNAQKLNFVKHNCTQSISPSYITTETWDNVDL